MSRTAVLACLALLLAVASGYWVLHGQAVVPVPQAAGAALALGVLGDSDSHSYQDRRSFPPASGLRGGAYRSSTLQWTEVLGRLRPGQLDPGDWGLHGRRRMLALAGRLVGLPAAAPRKEDYRYNFAVSRTGCEDLMEGQWRLARALAEEMRREPGRWKDGVVVVRIGANSFDRPEQLEQLAQDPRHPEVQREIAACVRAHGQALELLRAVEPSLRVVLVGIFNNAHSPINRTRWQSAREQANIDVGLDVFDNALRAMAAADPRVAFFDDRAWFAERWGSRDRQGVAAYRSARVGTFAVEYSIGDSPGHVALEDGHAGTGFNALWAQSLVALINSRFRTRIPPLGDSELESLLRVGDVPVDRVASSMQEPRL